MSESKMDDETTQSIDLWNLFKKGSGDPRDRVYVYISLKSWQIDRSKAKSAEDGSFEAQCEQVRQVVCATLTQAKHRVARIKYVVVRLGEDRFGSFQQGHHYTWGYETLDEIEEFMICDEPPTAIVLVSDYETGLLETMLKESESPTIITIDYRQTSRLKEKTCESDEQGEPAMWLDIMPSVNITYRPQHEWRDLSESYQIPKPGPNSDTDGKGEVGVSAPEKRKRQEETDDYLSFVERTMAAYKKL